MSTRHLARIVALQTLFELDFMNKPLSLGEEVVIRNVLEHAPELKGDASFAQELVVGVAAKGKDLDLVIARAAPEWPLEKISYIDRNVLRVGLFELLFSDRDKVPAKVAINEAIELAKRFGGEASGRFVNGVLGAVYKEIGEPGKNELSKKEKNNIPFEEMPIERLVGAIIFAREGDDIYLALVHDVFGHWTLSKGHLGEGEAEKKGIVRVVKEEVGLLSDVIKKLGSNEYVASVPEKGKVRKQVNYYLVEAPFNDLTLKETGGLDDARWFRLADIIDLNFYDDILTIVTKAVNLLLAKSKPSTDGV